MAWVLRLVSMQSQTLMHVARADTREALLAFMQRETVRPYREGSWDKDFRPGGPLEWFVHPGLAPECAVVNVGDADKWAEEARAKFNHQIGSLPEVTTKE